MNIQELNNSLKNLKQDGDLPGAEALLKKWVAISKNDADFWLTGITLTTFALTEGHLQDAFSYAAELLKVDPGDPHINYLSGLIARLLGEPQQARAFLDRALALGTEFNDPNLYIYTTELCKVYLDLGMFNECYTLCFSDWHLEDPIKSALASKTIARLLVLSDLYKRQKLYQQSIEYVKRAHRLANVLPEFCAMSILEELVSIQNLKSDD